MRRGDIWWAELGPPRGSAPAFRRPLLVIQCDPANRSEIATVVCIALTGNLRLGAIPGNVVAEPEDTGLPRRSVINVSHVVTVDKETLEEHAGHLPPPLMDAVETGLKRMLDLW